MGHNLKRDDRRNNEGERWVTIEREMTGETMRERGGSQFKER